MSNDFTMKWRGKEVTAAVKDKAVTGLKNAAEVLLDASNQLAPIDEGNLIASGETSVDPVELKASVFYDVPYAIKQHEDMTLKHKNGRSAKYLQRAYQNNIKRLRDYLADAVKI